MMRRSVADVSMGDSKQEEEEDGMEDIVPPMHTNFSTPKNARRQPSESFEYSVTPEPSRRRLSTSRGRQPPAGLEESPARYSPSKVKAAVRSFADFLHFLEQEEHQQEHTLMPVIIQRFAELGAVIESQKRHIDRWKGKELDLAIEEAQQNLELIKELGETIEKQELELASNKVEKQKWEEKYLLAAQEVEALKKQGTYQIQQLRSEVAMMRQAGIEVETKLKARDASLETMQKANEKFQTQLKQMEHDSSVIMQENTTLKQQRDHQAVEMHALEQEADELREHYEAVVGKATELEHNVSAWQAKYETKEHQYSELEDALRQDRREIGERERSLEHVIAENRKLQDHVDRMAQEHEHQLSEQHRYHSESEAERLKLTQTLQQESARFQKEAEEMQAQVEAQAMAAMKQREQQLLDEKSRVEEELQHQFSKINQENIELRAEVESLRDVSQRNNAEMSRLMAISREAEQQQQSRNMDNQRMQQLMEEVEHAKRQIESLSSDMAAKDAAHAEAMKTHATVSDNRYNDFVAQVEGQYNEVTQENEQLQANYDDASRRLDVGADRLSSVEEELGKWTSECKKLQRQLHEGLRENEALKLELERHVQELEMKKTEIAELNAHIQHFSSRDNELTRQFEELEMERARLEEFKRQIDSTRAEAVAKVDEAQEVHNRSLEQQAAHKNSIRSLCNEKEELNHAMVTLSSEKATLEFQVTSARNEIEHWKASAHQFEKEKHDLELKLQEFVRQATEQIESQKQTAALATVDGRTQLQRLTSQLVQRDTQMSEGNQQLRSLQDTVRSLEDQIRTQKYDFESVRMKKEQMSSQLESLHHEIQESEQVLRTFGTSFLNEDQLHLEGDLAQKLEILTREMEQQLLEESDKSNRLQAVVDSNQDELKQQFDEEIRKMEDENVGLQQRLKKYSEDCEKLNTEVVQLQRERKEQERALKETIATQEKEKWTRNNSTGDFRRLEIVHKDLKAAHEQLRRQTVAEVKEKESRIADLIDELAELQSKLDQEKDNSRHLMDSSRVEKKEYAEKLFKSSRVVEEQKTRVEELESSMRKLKLQINEQSKSSPVDEEQKSRVKELEALVRKLKLQINEQSKSSRAEEEQKARVEELEALVSKLQHKLQTFEQSKTGKEQNAMHEKLQKEREFRSLQTRYDSLAAENSATLQKLDAKNEEVGTLRQELHQLNEKVVLLQEEIDDNMTEMDNARSHFHVSEQLTLKLEEMQDDVAAHEAEARQLEDELAIKEKALQHAVNAEHELKRDFENIRHELEDEAATLKQQNAKFREQLKRATQAALSKSSAEAEAEARQVEMRELKEAYDQSVQREQDLTAQIDHLEEVKADMLRQFRREMEKLNVKVGVEGSNANGFDENAFHRGIMEVSALLRSYQDRETRQDALIHRKEKQINELKVRLNELEANEKKHDGVHRRDIEDSFHQELEAMGEEVSKLKLENHELREHHRPAKNEEVSTEATRKWKEKCEDLQQRVRELKDANLKIKQNRFSKADMKSLVKEIDNLTEQVSEKEMQLQALRKRDNARLRTSGSSTAPIGSRRSRDLLIALQEKEDKIMMLNDHLTGLMTENMRLQHSTEQYTVRYGVLEGTTTNGVIGNSGIRVPARANNNQPAPAVRSQ